VLHENSVAYGANAAFSALVFQRFSWVFARFMAVNDKGLKAFRPALPGETVNL
jgi:hypothetical protein